MPPTPEIIPSRPSRTPWLLLVITVLAVVAPFFLISRGKEIIDWRTDIDAALAEAKAANKPVLIDFTASWCPPCKMMKQEVFSKPEVKAAVDAGFIPLRVDVTDRNAKSVERSQRFDVKYLPTYLVVTPDGQELRRKVGVADTDVFIRWMQGRGP